MCHVIEMPKESPDNAENPIKIFQVRKKIRNLASTHSYPIHVMSRLWHMELFHMIRFYLVHVESDESG